MLGEGWPWDQDLTVRAAAKLTAPAAAVSLDFWEKVGVDPRYVSWLLLIGVVRVCEELQHSIYFFSPQGRALPRDACDIAQLQRY